MRKLLFLCSSIFFSITINGMNPDKAEELRLTAVFASDNVEHIHKCLKHPSFEQLSSKLKTKLLWIFLDSNTLVLNIETLNTITDKLLTYGADPFFINNQRSAFYYADVHYKDSVTNKSVRKINIPLQFLWVCNKLDAWTKDCKEKENLFNNNKIIEPPKNWRSELSQICIKPSSNAPLHNNLLICDKLEA